MALFPFFVSWVSRLTDWNNPLDRFSRQVLISILLENPLELRLAVLNYQIKQMMLKHV
jgi:hypothetical protein